MFEIKNVSLLLLNFLKPFQNDLCLVLMCVVLLNSAPASDPAASTSTGETAPRSSNMFGGRFMLVHCC